MSNRNSDGTYIFPDQSVSLVWQNEHGGIVVRSTDGLNWCKRNSLEDACQIVRGRWLPWLYPTFPVRDKCSMRLCLLSFGGSVRKAVWIDRHQYYRDEYNSHIHPTGATVVKWLTPEYEDETPGMENMSNGVQSSE